MTASPLRRTIYTALLSFEPVFKEKKDVKVVAIPEAQETSDVPCDTGSDPDFLKKEFEEKKLPVDLSLVKEGWNTKVRRVASHVRVGVSFGGEETDRRWLYRKENGRLKQKRSRTVPVR